MSSSSSSSQRPPESRFPCHYDDRSSSCVPPSADWVNHNQPPSSSVMTRSRNGGESHFDFFYHAIFTFVHSALTILLAPVLKNTTRRPKSRSSSPSRTQRATAMPPQSLYREVDPELAMPPQMNYERSSSNNNNSSILKSHQRRDSYQQQQQAAQSAAAAKSVRFPEPKRSRTPLGRISSSIGSTTSSTSASVSSSESSRSSSSLSSSSSSSDGTRGRISPWRVSPSPRTHHSTYFLSE